MPRKYYSSRDSEDTRTLRPSVQPIWNGIGFALIIITPILGYFGAILLLEQNARYRWVDIPPSLIIPEASNPQILVIVIVTVTLIFLLGAIFSAITFLLYSLFVPSRYGPMDAPIVRYRGRQYKR
jgi:hypothetical protein